MSKPHTLDTSGLLCPLPVIRTAEAVANLSAGDILIVTATDPGTMQDIPAWCRVHEHALETSEALDRTYRFTIRVN